MSVCENMSFDALPLVPEDGLPSDDSPFMVIEGRWEPNPNYWKPRLAVMLSEMGLRAEPPVDVTLQLFERLNERRGG